MTQAATIHCPKCGHEFNVEDALSRQIEERHRQELAVTIRNLESQFHEKEMVLSSREAELKKQLDEVDSEVRRRLTEETSRKEVEIRSRIEADFEARIAAMNEERDRTAKEIRELKAAQVENLRLKRELEEKEQQLALEFERKLSDRLKEAAESIQQRETEKIGLKLRERDELIDALKKQVDEMKRKAEQGSMQMQGEVLELQLEELLCQEFPFDLVEEVGKGVRGADVIQTVRSRLGADCGKIIFESKRTKAFAADWIPKLKADAVSANADVCVIVSEALPAGIERIGQIDGVWICSFSHVKGLVLVLRDSLLRIHEAYGSQANKGEKMQMLYDYLTSNEFRLQVGAIIDGFTSLQAGYQKERNAMERIWKEREKQLQKVLLNTNHFLGSIKGIAGSTLGQLQLPGGDDLLLEPDGDTE